jgi:hypothetical protein
MRVYAPLRCIVKVENGCAGPWNAAVGIKMLPTKTIHAMLLKNRAAMLQFFLRVCRATDRFTRREGVLGVHVVPTNTPTYPKKWSTAKKWFGDQIPWRAHTLRPSKIQQGMYESHAYTPRKGHHGKFVEVTGVD